MTLGTYGGTGWLPDEPDERDFDARDLLTGSTGPLPDFIDLRPHMRRMVQVGESCVMNSVVAAWCLCASAEGHTLPTPSRSHGYYKARELEGGDIVDRGCYPRLALQAPIKYGICAEARWPHVDATINQAPPWDAQQHAYDARIDSFYRVWGYDDERLDACHLGLHRKKPFLVGTLVDSGLKNAGPDTIGRATGLITGRHMMLGVVRDRARGRWGLQNWWGIGHGDEGIVWVSDDRLASTDCDDVYMVKLAPRMVT